MFFHRIILGASTNARSLRLTTGLWECGEHSQRHEACPPRRCRTHCFSTTNPERYVIHLTAHGRYHLIRGLGERGSEDDGEFRIFKKQLYHAALAHLLSSLRPWMTTPLVVRCPDGHFRRAIFQLGPFIADYPEQVYLSGVVQGWCPKCGVTIDRLNGFDSNSSHALDVLPDLKIWRQLEILDSVN